MTQSKTGLALGIAVALGFAIIGCAGSDDTELHQARLLRLEDGQRSTEGDKPAGGDTTTKPSEETATKEEGGDVPTEPSKEEPAPEPKPTECIVSKIVRETCTSNDELEAAAREKFTNIKELSFSNDCERGSTIVKVYHCG
jgi:hypothetical protein